MRAITLSGGTNAEPAFTTFNNASPTAYAFPFDDAIKLFACSPKSGSVTNYTVNFCADDGDGDSIQGSVDADRDGDGITDDNETFVSVNAATRGALLNDMDGDGIENALDLDSDNDGLPDILEADGREFDSDGDGKIDDQTDADGDGLADVVDPDQGGTELIPVDTDGDGMADFIDIDSDNESGTDFEENNGIEMDGDGLPDGTMDENSDGLLDMFDPARGGMPLEELDNDGDGVPNQLDTSGGGSGNCSLAPVGTRSGAWPLYLLIPALIFCKEIYQNID